MLQFLTCVFGIVNDRVDGAGSLSRIFVLESRASEKQTLGQILYFPLIFFVFGIIVGT